MLEQKSVLEKSSEISLSEEEKEKIDFECKKIRIELNSIADDVKRIPGTLLSAFETGFGIRILLYNSHIKYSYILSIPLIIDGSVGVISNFYIHRKKKNAEKNKIYLSTPYDNGMYVYNINENMIKIDYKKDHFWKICHELDNGIIGFMYNKIKKYMKSKEI